MEIDLMKHHIFILGEHHNSFEKTSFITRILHDSVYDFGATNRLDSWMNSLDLDSTKVNIIPDAKKEYFIEAKVNLDSLCFGTGCIHLDSCNINNYLTRGWIFLRNPILFPLFFENMLDNNSRRLKKSLQGGESVCS